MKLALSNINVTLNEFLVTPVAKDEYVKNSKVLSKSPSTAPDRSLTNRISRQRQVRGVPEAEARGERREGRRDEGGPAPRRKGRQKGAQGLERRVEPRKQARQQPQETGHLGRIRLGRAREEEEGEKGEAPEQLRLGGGQRLQKEEQEAEAEEKEEMQVRVGQRRVQEQGRQARADEGEEIQKESQEQG